MCSSLALTESHWAAQGPRWPSSHDCGGWAERRKSQSIPFCSLFKWSFWHYKVAFCTRQIPKSLACKRVLFRPAACARSCTDIALLISGSLSSSPCSHCDPTQPFSLAGVLHRTTLGGTVYIIFGMNGTPRAIRGVPLALYNRVALYAALTQGQSHHQARRLPIPSLCDSVPWWASHWPE